LDKHKLFLVHKNAQKQKGTRLTNDFEIAFLRDVCSIMADNTPDDVPNISNQENSCGLANFFQARCEFRENFNCKSRGMENTKQPSKIENIMFMKLDSL
jgi:hypothetical protein